jgi:hypothetical protein
MLLERRRKRRERGLQLGAKTRDHGNDLYRDGRRDQAVLDIVAAFSSFKNPMIRRMSVAFRKSRVGLHDRL